MNHWNGLGIFKRCILKSYISDVLVWVHQADSTTCFQLGCRGNLLDMEAFLLCSQYWWMQLPPGGTARLPGQGDWPRFFSLGSSLRISHAELRWLRAILATNRNHASNLAGWDVINEPMIHPDSIHCVGIFIPKPECSENPGPVVSFC